MPGPLTVGRNLREAGSCNLGVFDAAADRGVSHAAPVIEVVVEGLCRPCHESDPYSQPEGAVFAVACKHEEPFRTSRLVLGAAGVCVGAPLDMVLIMPGPQTGTKVDKNLRDSGFRSGAAGGVGSEAFDDGALEHGGALVSVERHGGSTLEETYAQVAGGFIASTREILVGAGFADEELSRTSR